MELCYTTYGAMRGGTLRARMLIGYEFREELGLTLIAEGQMAHCMCVIDQITASGLLAFIRYTVQGSSFQAGFKTSGTQLMCRGK